MRLEEGGVGVNTSPVVPLHITITRDHRNATANKNIQMVSLKRDLDKKVADLFRKIAVLNADLATFFISSQTDLACHGPAI